MPNYSSWNLEENIKFPLYLRIYRVLHISTLDTKG